MTVSTPLLKRIAINDRSAVDECIAAYGPVVWLMARHFAETPDDVETATREIFLSIWRSAKMFESSGLDEKAFILAVARCSLNGGARQTIRQVRNSRSDAADLYLNPFSQNLGGSNYENNKFENARPLP